MTISGFQSAVRFIGVFGVIAAVGVFVWPHSVAAAPVADTATAATAKKSATKAGASLKVTVSLSPALAKQAAPDDVVFIFARAVSGPRMPLAIVRKQVKDLPATVVLDDSQGMSPQMSLSSVPEVIVVARVSKSGMATAQAGDLEGVSEPVKRGTRAVTLSIASQVAGQKESGTVHGNRY
jgi:cytochrome c-type biogenesis protein CcmH